MTTAALTLESRVTEVEVLVREDHKLLHGNGQKGLESKVNTLEAEHKVYAAKFDEIEDEQKELDDKLDKITVSLATLQGTITALKESIDLIKEKNKWWKELIRNLGWLISLGFAAYEAFFR